MDRYKMLKIGLFVQRNLLVILIIGGAIAFVFGIISAKIEKAQNPESEQGKHTDSKQVASDNLVQQPGSKTESNDQWRVYGTVTNQSTGQPIFGCHVYLTDKKSDADFQKVLVQKTNEQGDYEFTLNDKVSQANNLSLTIESGGYTSVTCDQIFPGLRNDFQLQVGN